MSRLIKYLVALVVVGAVVGGGVLWMHSPAPVSMSAPKVATTPVPVATTSPPIASTPTATVMATPTPIPTPRFPVPESTPEMVAGVVVARKPLPVLDESDHSIEGELRTLFGKERFSSLFDPKDLIRKIVTAIDGLPGRELSLEVSPVNRAKKKFQVLKQGSLTVIDPKNSERYLPYVKLATSLDLKKFTSLYFRFYPLFQAAYRDLGSEAYFNDRLVEVIDHLLLAPETPVSPEVIQAATVFQWVDENLERLSVGQKILVRMGSQNENQMKEVLRQFRTLVTQQKQP